MTELKDYSTIAGWSSLVFWLLYGFPQIYENWHLKSGHGLSLRFIFVWLLGDAFNLTGCFLANQLQTQLYLAIWFVLFDTILLGQVIYYEHVKKSFGDKSEYRSIVEGQVDEEGRIIDYQESGYHVINNDNNPSGSAPCYIMGDDEGEDDEEWDANGSTCSSILSVNSPMYESPNTSFIANDERAQFFPNRESNVRSLFAFYNERTNELEKENNFPSPSRSRLNCVLIMCGLFGTILFTKLDVNDDSKTSPIYLSRTLQMFGSTLPLGTCVGVECTVGTVLGWISAFIYLVARFPQLIRNCLQRRCQPLVEAAVFVLWCGMLGNLMYGLSIILRAGSDNTFDTTVLPWLVGSLGSVPCDLLLFFQHFIWKESSRT